MGCSSLQTYTSALHAPYPLAKLDLVGLPNFAAGAMENWGCITFRWMCVNGGGRPQSGHVSVCGYWVAGDVPHSSDER